MLDGLVPEVLHSWKPHTTSYTLPFVFRKNTTIYENFWWICVVMWPQNPSMQVSCITIRRDYRITGNVCCDFIFAKVKKRENLNTCNFHNTCILYCACSVCAKIKSRKNLKLKNFTTQTFSVICHLVSAQNCEAIIEFECPTVNLIALSILHYALYMEEEHSLLTTN